MELRQARASENDMRILREVMESLQDYLESGFVTDHDTEEVHASSDSEFVAHLRKIWSSGRCSVDRVLWGYTVMFQNSCDSEKSYLDWKPSISQKMKLNADLLTACKKSLEDFKTVNESGQWSGHPFTQAVADLEEVIERANKSPE
jgi:hypothetical protein